MIVRWDGETRQLWLDPETFSRVVRVHAEVLQVVMPGCDTSHIRALMLEQTIDRLTVILGGPIPLGDWRLMMQPEPKPRIGWYVKAHEDCEASPCGYCLMRSY